MVETSIADIQPSESRDYLAEPLVRDNYKVFFQSCEDMPEIPDNTVHLWFTSPMRLCEGQWHTLRMLITLRQCLEY